MIILFGLKDHGILINYSSFLFYNSKTSKVINWSTDDNNKQKVIRIK